MLLIDSGSVTQWIETFVSDTSRVQSKFWIRDYNAHECIVMGNGEAEQVENSGIARCSYHHSHSVCDDSIVRASIDSSFIFLKTYHFLYHYPIILCYQISARNTSMSMLCKYEIIPSYHSFHLDSSSTFFD